MAKDAAETQGTRVLGTSQLRLEDAALLTGQGRYADDVGEPKRTLQAHIIRSSEPHAIIKSISVDKALAMDGVANVITGADIRKLTDPFLVAVKAPVDQWSLAVDRVRFVGEPVAVILAESRYVAEDAAELVEIVYEKLPAVVDCEAAVRPDAPLLHDPAGTNEVHTREFTYGDPDAAFAAADRVVKTRVTFPRSSYTPMECFVVVAEYKSSDGVYDVLANFQGPFSAHPVMARALRVPGPQLRLRTPADSGGSFGIKLSVFPYIVLMGICSRIAGRPVKWVEDRLEHLQAASSAPNRVTHIEAAVMNDGKVTALRMDNLEDYGAFLRAPMPGPLYRMQGATTGAYDIRHLYMNQRVVLTNKQPAALVRGFGGPQLYLALERLMQRIAITLDMDPLEVIRRNLIAADAFPYRTTAGALYDSGDYQKAIDIAVGDGRLDELYRRRDEARANGKKYGIGFATVVEPGMSNMGYLSTLLPPSVREKTGPKNGAVSIATVSVDGLGAVSVTSDVTVQGQGHQTTIAQIVAQQLGLTPEQIRVNLEIDTQKDQWSIAAGSYSCRFSPGAAVAVHLAAERIRDRVARIGAKLLNVLPEDVVLEGGRVFSRTNPDNRMPFERVAGTAHWSPILVPEGDEPALKETAFWSPPELAPPTSKDEINTSLTYGFVFDICGVEIDPVTMDVRIDRYITMHDAGTLLNPMLAEGQIRGGFRAGPRDRAVRGIRLRRQRVVPVGYLCRLPDPDRLRSAGDRDPAHRIAHALYPPRGQGSGRGQLHVHAGLSGECGGRCAWDRRRSDADHSSAAEFVAGGGGVGTPRRHRTRGPRGSGWRQGADRQGQVRGRDARRNRLELASGPRKPEGRDPRLPLGHGGRGKPLPRRCVAWRGADQGPLCGGRLSGRPATAFLGPPDRWPSRTAWRRGRLRDGHAE